MLYSDATAAINLGFGAIFNEKWLYQCWETGFIQLVNPSIEFLEFYALCVAVFVWSNQLKNSCFILFCDNQSVCDMIENGCTSGCKYCMTLIRRLTERLLHYNFRVFAKHVSSKDNFLADSLSRMQLELFQKQARRHKLRSIQS